MEPTKRFEDRALYSSYVYVTFKLSVELSNRCWRGDILMAPRRSFIISAGRYGSISLFLIKYHHTFTDDNIAEKTE